MRTLIKNNVSLAPGLFVTHKSSTYFEVFKRFREKGRVNHRDTHTENDTEGERIIKSRELKAKLICSLSVPKEVENGNENSPPDAYGGRLVPISIPLREKTSLFLKVIVALIRERVLLRVTAEGLRGSG